MYIEKCRLFKGISHSDAEKILKNGKARQAVLEKGQTVFHEGAIIREIGIVAEGVLEGVRFLADGSRDVAAVLTVGDIFGDVLAVSEGRGAPITLVCASNAKILFLPFEGILCGKNPCNITVLHNLLACISDKYFDLNFRISCITCRTLSEKIMFYLNGVSGGSREAFNIPLDRNALADFLCAERSALSRELSRLKKAGIIDYYKNTFKIL